MFIVNKQELNVYLKSSDKVPNIFSPDPDPRHPLRKDRILIRPSLDVNFRKLKKIAGKKFVVSLIDLII